MGKDDDDLPETAKAESRVRETDQKDRSDIKRPGGLVGSGGRQDNGEMTREEVPDRPETAKPERKDFPPQPVPRPTSPEG